MKKVIALILTTILVMSMLVGCTPVAPNTVFSIDDLPGKVIGVQLGTTGDIYASDYEEEGSTLERFNKGADAVQALKQGKVDCVIIDSEPAKAFVAKNKDLMILADPFELEEYAMCISKSNFELKGNINAAIAQLKSDGTLESIISNYIGDDTKGKSPYVSNNTDYSNGKLKMATNAQFEPYEFVEGGVITGIDVDLAQAVADILKMELVIEDMDFDAIIAAVQSGKADIGVAGMTVTEDRLISVDFTDSYTTATQVIIVRVK
ncbi:MAG TPA: transporter substrate-binding domain-containing protein [Clostridia bacterium]|nr:transporter substrate-binding domain-containing protein [Clostridia bacterium]MDD4502305.1 transporter substrate-binding domain-containing protein [Clostridia bacterium]HPB16281.1 transporter substrate-binding domain-containing protein [Clostridia bacterium]HQM97182.1 transporter substrate-binding domain-containing protein [Clostridia bacterium]HQO68867.1 transporter substrate-binding domain-containing protein [Clostridia bacterium]